MLLQGNTTSLFHGNPKLQDSFLNFLELRPVCSGSDSCSKRLSELNETYIEPPAQQLPTYIQGTTGFINKTF